MTHLTRHHLVQGERKLRLQFFGHGVTMKFKMSALSINSLNFNFSTRLRKTFCKILTFLLNFVQIFSKFLNLKINLQLSTFFIKE